MKKLLMIEEIWYYYKEKLIPYKFIPTTKLNNLEN